MIPKPVIGKTKIKIKMTTQSKDIIPPLKKTAYEIDFEQISVL